jgi:hypothetical protein
MADISGFGTRAKVIASNTFPVGFSVTEFADDSDPVDLPSIKIGDSALGLNGDLLTWATAIAIPISISVFANSDADTNLSILLNANRVAKGKSAAGDSITLILSYPNGDVLTLTKGAIMEGMVAPSIASAGRLKTNTYTFSFSDYVKATA